MDYGIDKYEYEYFDMAITGLPNHSLLVAQNMEAKTRSSDFCTECHAGCSTCAVLGSEFKGIEGVSLQKVPSNVRAVRSLSGIFRGLMSKELESKTDFHGYAHLDGVKRELLTGRFHKEVSSWSVETFIYVHRCI